MGFVVGRSHFYFFIVFRQFPAQFYQTPRAPAAAGPRVVAFHFPSMTDEYREVTNEELEELTRGEPFAYRPPRLHETEETQEPHIEAVE